MILAAAALVMACGGNSDKKEDAKKEDAKQTEQTKELTVEEKAVDFNNRFLEAMEKGDEAAAEKIQAEGDAWFESLSEEDMQKAEAAQDKWAKENMQRIMSAM